MKRVKAGMVVVFTLITVFAVGDGSMGAGGVVEVREVDSFTSSGKAGQLEGWVSADKNFSKLYSIGQEGDNFFLQAAVKGKGVIIAKEFGYALKEYPLLSWKWRAKTFPKDGDERYQRSGDSAAGVYIIFPSLLKPEKMMNGLGIKIPIPDTMKPECIKYVWSSTLPRGTVTESPYSSKTRIVVLESGNSTPPEWIMEEVNVYEDYKKLFQKEPEAVRAVGILTDADDTSSEAAADYDDIFIKKATVQQTKNTAQEKKEL